MLKIRKYTNESLTTTNEKIKSCNYTCIKQLKSLAYQLGYRFEKLLYCTSISTGIIYFTIQSTIRYMKSKLEQLEDNKYLLSQ